MELQWMISTLRYTISNYRPYELRRVELLHYFSKGGCALYDSINLSLYGPLVTLFSFI